MPSENKSADPAQRSALDADVASVSGVGPRRSAALHTRHIGTLADALTHIPYRYEDLRRRDEITELRPGTTAILEGVLQEVADRPMRGRWSRRIATALLKQASGKSIPVVWFNLRSQSLPSGEPLVLVGRANHGLTRMELVHPEIYRLRNGPPPPIRPVYSLPAEVPQRLFAAILAQALRQAYGHSIGSLPTQLRKRDNLQDIIDALQYLHQPPANANLEKLQTGETPAHRALALDEMFTFQVALARERARLRIRAGAALNGPAKLTPALRASLPFTLTPSQLRSIAEISAELAGPSQMNRILIGDVGSGKTIVAFDAVLRAVESGWQAAIMAPTELLAEQHFATFNKMCGPLGVTAALLTGKITGAERARLLRALQRGDIPVAFGTHALIQDGVAMSRLGIVIIDEQHRFGVFHRARLRALGSQANVLLMTATPIPRSLAMGLFRNLDVSSLDEMPPGRIAVRTEVIGEKAMASVDSMVRAQLELGRRAYYIVPLIEGEDEPESVIATAKRLRTGPLKGSAIGILHGRMRPAEKDEVMRQFRDGAVQVLVSTTVVEVGIDVPQASIIVIVAAERYGMAQLHQLRGRVGRGADASQCWFVLSQQTTPEARARIELLARCNTGEQVAQFDLSIRGPGDLFGARQTGALPLRFASFIRDCELIKHAADLAEEWLQYDPELTTVESSRVRKALARMLEFGVSLADVG
ncbi:MAG: ATP-dependent DNA helicase RecG [Deltaproteobacteria bacterium]|nr:ATP-dependent DNA helicase RecG [Deltaproteobacteria bacterium]